MTDSLPKGAYAPVLTPFAADLTVDRHAFAGFCHWLISQDTGLAVFGTNSEGNSLAVGERLELVDYLIGTGLPPDRMMPGTGACALPEAVALCAGAARARVGAVLMLPPFYYKDVSDGGLFAFYAETIERVGSADLRICLYHIPQISGVRVSMALIERLLGRYPATVIGIKDSSGDMGNTLAMLKAFPGFRVFCGSEKFLTETVRQGGAGCISASANLNSGAIAEAFRRIGEPHADDRQQALNHFRSAFEGVSMIAALKRMVAEFGQYAGFARLRPPLVPLEEGEAALLAGRLRNLGFVAPGLAAVLSSHS